MTSSPGPEQLGLSPAEIAKVRTLAEQGNTEAQLHLGIMYATGRGVPQDAAEAARWYRLGADQGHARAQWSLGLMYDKGEAVPQDYAEAARWYRLAADQGDGLAMTGLGVMYATGAGVPQDYVQAQMWLNLAASRLTGEAREDAVGFRDRVAGLMNPAQIAEAQRLAREWDVAHPREPP